MYNGRHHSIELTVNKITLIANLVYVGLENNNSRAAWNLLELLPVALLIAYAAAGFMWCRALGIGVCGHRVELCNKQAVSPVMLGNTQVCIKAV